MNWIGLLLLIIHVLACSALILMVLLQAGKGASVGAAFGGGASQTVFGARSATFIGRLTWVLFGVFLLTSLLLTIISPWQAQAGLPADNILQEEAVPPSSETAPMQQGAPEDILSGEVTPAPPDAPAQAPAAGSPDAGSAETHP